MELIYRFELTIEGVQVVRPLRLPYQKTNGTHCVRIEKQLATGHHQHNLDHISYGLIELLSIIVFICECQ